MSIGELLTLVFSVMFIENFVFSKFWGICPFLGVSKKVGTSVGMGMAVTFVMGVASAVTYYVNELLILTSLEYMRTIAYILVIATLVQFVEMFLRKSMPALYSSLGIFLPLITTNCAVLGVTLLNESNGYNLIESITCGVAGGLGFTVAIVIFASLRERLEFTNPPKAFKGLPVALVTAGLLAMAFTGLAGIKIG